MWQNKNYVLIELSWKGMLDLTICNQFVIWFYVLLKKRETMIQSIDWKKNTQNKTKNKIPLSIWIQHISWWLNIYNSTDDNNSIRSSSSVIRFCSFFIISSIKVILFLLTSFFFQHECSLNENIPVHIYCRRLTFNVCWCISMECYTRNA